MSVKSELLPRGEPLRRAVQWISERREEEPHLPLWKVIDEAARRFDLSPADSEFLFRQLSQPAA